MPEQFRFTSDDRNNLRFILAKQQEGENHLDEWLDSISEDDLMYTLDLLKAYTSMRERFVSVFD